MSDEQSVKVVEEKKHTQKREVKKSIRAKRISGIMHNGNIMFRGNKRLKFRLVPKDLWAGGEAQDFTEEQFSSFDKPAFYNGE